MLIPFHHLFKGTSENQIHYRAQCALHEGNIEMRNQKRIQKKISNLFESMNSFLFGRESKEVTLCLLFMARPAKPVPPDFQTFGRL